MGWSSLSVWPNKSQQVLLFSSTAIALYGYDQGMMSLINTNRDYLWTMGISSSSGTVGLIVAVYYLGCALGAVLASGYADRHGRRPSIFLCLATASLGNLIMFLAGLGFRTGALAMMFIGRVVMGLGVGGIDSVIPVYSAELSKDEARGKALAQQFQANILGLNLAFALNLALTNILSNSDEWAWRVPIIAMQVFPIVLMLIIRRLPESPRYLIFNDRKSEAQKSLGDLFSQDEAGAKLDDLVESHNKQDDERVTYWQMFTVGHDQFHPTIITIMGQVNQALTGYGAVSVYGPQIFELLGWPTDTAEYLTQGNYVSYLFLMTFAWLLIDVVGRRALMVWNSAGLTISFLLLVLFGGLVKVVDHVAVSVLGTVTLFIATGNFGIGWLATVWLIPTEIYPTSARAQGTAISVIIWGLANFAITLLTPIMFNNLGFWIFLVFAATNLFAGAWTYKYLPESGNRSFEENQRFFAEAKEAGSWQVSEVCDGEFKRLPSNMDGSGESGDGEREPLLRRVRRQL